MLGDPLGVHFAVISGPGGQVPGEGQAFNVAAPVIYGTGFRVGINGPNSYIATAAHVYQGAAADGAVAVVRLIIGGPMHVFPVARFELFGSIDLALLDCPGINDAPKPFDFSSLRFFEPVGSIGFPFAVDPEHLTLGTRAFAGHVVTRRPLNQLAGRPPGYELSFVAPPGLSGAPLLVERGGQVRICGVILQHYANETAGVVTNLGIALDSQELLRPMHTSQLAGGSLANQLFGVAARDP